MTAPLEPVDGLTYLSAAAPVSMGDAWFQAANLKHFWIQRRFDVFRCLCRRAGVRLEGASVGEIGCGSGLVQEQVYRSFGTRVDGFDLNEYALRHAVDPANPRFVYDIHDRHATLAEKYDVLILFDVIEHIDDDAGFLESALFHLKSGGYLVVNVPALQWLYSKYDEAAGHVRRYSLRSLVDVLKSQRGKVVTDCYWGMPYVPLLTLRKALGGLTASKSQTIANGFGVRSELTNTLLGLVGRMEPIPQQFIGTSAMAIFQKS
jgi:SAM-dependent methyltransferase